MSYNKKVTLILFVVGFLAAVAAWVDVFILRPPVNSLSQDQVTLSLSVDELYEAFMVDPVLANSRYKGERVRVWGIVNAVDVMDNSVFIYLAPSDDSITIGGVSCLMEPSENSKAKKLESGTTINIEGICTGVLGNDVILEMAKIVD